MATTAAVQERMDQGFCAKCGKEGGDNGVLSRCSARKVTSYCSTQCQRAHWKVLDKEICRLFGAWTRTRSNHDIMRATICARFGVECLKRQLHKGSRVILCVMLS